MTDTVAVVGAGTMGAGIAQVAALAGHPVLLLDARPGAAEEAVRTVGAKVLRLAERGRVPAPEAEAARGRLRWASSPTDLAECAEAMVVVEAVAEDLAAKRALFAELETVVGPDTLLATNTSSLSVTAVARGLARPERVVGMHFFNPAERMRLVEVVRGELSGPAYVQLATNLARCWGKVPVLCTSTPGFVVNRVNRPFYGEAQRLVEAGVADVATVDAMLREAGGFPLGPFELTDLIGQDVNLAVGRSVWEQTDHDPRYTPTDFQQRLVDAGRLGRKSGRGAYDEDAPPPLTAGAHAPPAYAVYRSGWSVLEPLLARVAAAGVPVVRRPPDVSGAAKSAESAGSAESAESAGSAGDGGGSAGDGGGVRLPSGGRLVEATGACAGSLGPEVVVLDWVLDGRAATRIAVSVSPGSRESTGAEAVGLLQAAGLAVTVLPDSPGLVVARTVAMLVNEAADLVARGEASAEDVETAMQLGAGHPRGPLAWGDRVGPARIAAVLEALDAADPSGRYRVGAGLARAVERQEPLHG